MCDRYIIIGGNAAGMSAAYKARRLNRDAEIIVYESTGEISVGACGIPYYIAGEFDDLHTMIARTPNQVAESGITLHLHTKITSLNSVKKEISGEDADGNQFTTTYTKLMIATGAHPFVPPIEGLPKPGVFVVKSLEDANAIREYITKKSVRNVVVVGGGFIGVEMAEAALALKKEVRLIELQNQLMPQTFDSDMAKHLQDEMEHQGVSLHLNESITGICGESTVEQVTASKGTYSADMVILALGVRPATEWIENSHIQQFPNGAIIVNDKGETSCADIFSAGDCSAVPHRVLEKHTYSPLATTANKLGRVVGENMAGGNCVYPGTIGSGSIRFCNIEGARVGISEKEAITHKIPYKTVTIEDKNHTNYTHGSASIWIKLIYDPQKLTILGAQLIGAPGAELRSYPLVIAIQEQLSVKELGFADFPYAPPFSRTWDILNVAGNVAK